MKIDGDSRTPAINELKDLIVSTRKLSKEEIKSHENTDQSGGGSGNSTSIDDDVFAVLTLEGSVAAREHIGGTAPVEVRAAAGRALARVEARVKQG